VNPLICLEGSFSHSIRFDKLERKRYLAKLEALFGGSWLRVDIFIVRLSVRADLPTVDDVET
jgi:hypothetical protein